MPKPTKNYSFDERVAIKTYLKLMVEFRVRVDLVNAACNGSIPFGPAYALEYCYFQYRRQCEIIALGCLLLHGDIQQTRSSDVKKMWNAHEIMRLLDRLHPDFFPRPVKRTQEGSVHKILTFESDEVLSKKDFIALYAACGDVLHRGSIKSIELEKGYTDEDFNRVVEWNHKLVKLMNEHLIIPASRNGHYLISIDTDAGGPQCSRLTSDLSDESKISVETFTMKA